MRIGLLRHFPVREKLPSGWRTSAELQSWQERYDLSETVNGEFDLGGIEWHTCVSSDLPRAHVTARTVFKGEIKCTPLLREARFAHFQTGNFRMPAKAWHWLLRLTWMTGHPSQRACRDDFRSRVAAVADQLSATTQDTLVVSHAGFMAYLSAELRRRGFTGPKLRIAEHAKVYVYGKP